MSKLFLLSTVALLAVAPFSPAFAADEHNTVPGLTAAGAPLGFHGVDPVAFLDLENRIDGSAKYTAVHDGVAYYFSTQKNLTAFEQNPIKYAPQHGGFCTYGVSVGSKFDGDPRFAAVENGKLYAFLNEEIFNAFQKDRAGTIAKADENWKQIQHTAAEDLK